MYNMNKFSVGSPVYFLQKGTLVYGVVFEIIDDNTVNIEFRYKMPNGKKTKHMIKKPTERCAMPTESIAVVWELWNCPSTYRIDRELYAKNGVPAKDWQGKYMLEEFNTGEQNEYV